MSFRNIPHAKEKIISATIEISNSKGFHATTARNVAKKAHLSTGKIFGIYKTKQGFFEAAKLYVENEINEIVELLLSKSLSSRDLMISLLSNAINNRDLLSFYRSYFLYFPKASFSLRSGNELAKALSSPNVYDEEESNKRLKAFGIALFSLVSSKESQLVSMDDEETINWLSDVLLGFFH